MLKEYLIQAFSKKLSYMYNKKTNTVVDKETYILKF